MTNPCQPNGVAAPSIDDPCAYLGQLRAALFQVLSGAGRAEVRMDGQTLRFHPANVGELRKEVIRLETLCLHGSRGRAVQVGPRRAVGFMNDCFPNGRYR